MAAQTKTPVEQGTHHDPAKFARLMVRGLPKCRAKLMCGYSSSYNVKRILSHPAARYVMQSIDDQRLIANNTPGTTLLDSVDFAQEIRDNSKEDTPDRLRANKQVIDTLGHNAPTVIQQDSRSLVIEFTGLGAQELEQFRGELPQLV